MSDFLCQLFKTNLSLSFEVIKDAISYLWAKVFPIIAINMFRRTMIMMKEAKMNRELRLKRFFWSNDEMSWLPMTILK